MVKTLQEKWSLRNRIQNHILVFLKEADKYELCLFGIKLAHEYIFIPFADCYLNTEMSLQERFHCREASESPHCRQPALQIHARATETEKSEKNFSTGLFSTLFDQNVVWDM